MAADVHLSSPLTGVRSILAVVAHPDDESFGLGGIVERLAAGGSVTAVLCFTHGEASTLHGIDGDLGTVRPAEFARATKVLGVAHSQLLDYPDGALDAVPLPELVAHVRQMAARTDPSHLLVFDVSGVTGHPDHQRATQAALAAADELDLPVLVWALPRRVATQLNAEFGTAFSGRPASDMDELTVLRARQWEAIACHASQSVDNPVLARRLELLGDVEHVFVLDRARGHDEGNGVSRPASPAGQPVPLR